MAAATNNENVFECAICLDDDGRERKVHDCGKHEFHKDCLRTAMRHNTSCPLCCFKPKPTMIRYLHLGDPIPCTICYVPIVKYNIFYKTTTCHHQLHTHCFIGTDRCPICNYVRYYYYVIFCYFTFYLMHSHLVFVA
jgi:Ring finger domain